MLQTVLRISSALLLVGVGIFGDSSTVGAEQGEACPISATTVDPVQLEIPSSRLGWDVVGLAFQESPTGYAVALLYVDAAQQYERVALATFDRTGGLNNLRWIGERHRSYAGQSASFWFESDGKLTVAWLYEPIEIERYDTIGDPDRSFGSNGEVIINLEDLAPGSSPKKTIVTYHEDGPIVIDADRSLIYSINADGSQVDGPFPQAGRLPTITPHTPFVITPERHLIQEDGASLIRQELDGTLVTNWGNGGQVPISTGNINRTFEWYYAADGSLFVNSLAGRDFSEFGVVEIAPDGLSYEVIDLSPTLPLGMARFRGTQTLLTLSNAIVDFEDPTNEILFYPEIFGGTREINPERMGLISLRDPRLPTETSVVRFLNAPPLVGPEGAGRLSDQVERLYSAYFERAPDADGLRYWRSERAAGRSLESVSEAFTSSPEFVETYGTLSNAEFVALVYTNVLGRSGEAEGQSFWTSQLDSGVARGVVMLEFSESSEFVELTATSPPTPTAAENSIQRLYDAFFGRPADTGGLCFWLAAFENGQGTLAQIAEGFVTSAEFADTYGELDDPEFVELVYQNVLDRPAEPAGRVFWIDQLEGGLTRGQLMVEFSESPEFILTSDTTL